MRRATRLGLGFLAVIVVLAGAYSVYWKVTAGRLKGGLSGWAQTAQARGLRASWKRLGVGGYPLAFRLALEDVELGDAAVAPAPRLRAPRLTASAHPWNMRHWRLVAEQGLFGESAGVGGKQPVALSVKTATGEIRAAADGSSTLSFDLAGLALAAAKPLEARAARLQIELPPHPARTYSEPNVSFSASLSDTSLPQAVPPLGRTIADLDFAVTILGPVPEGPLPQAAAAWRDAGGTIELKSLDFRWGALSAKASGTLALDRDLQPVGGFSGAVEGWEQIIAALVAQGTLSPEKAGLARLALTLLAKAGPDGRPQISTSFTIQNGKMYLGPAQLGKAPHIDWH